MGHGLLAGPAQGAVIGRSAEISLGREAAQEYERQEPVDVDPVLAARVRRIGNRLIAAGESWPYPFEFHAVDTNAVNAFALPGGYIYMFRGLAQLVPGDDALAFIMAHEIIHVSRRHGIRQMEKSLAIGTLLNFALRSGTTSGILHYVIDMHHSRRDEIEADRLGLELMARAGFDPTQGAEAMAVIARTAKAGRFLPAFLRTHPLPESRIASLRRQAAALRAAPRPAREVRNAPPLDPPPQLAPPPAAVRRTELFPLAAGMRWTYRVSGMEKQPALVTTILEEQRDHPGVFRARFELEEGLAVTRLLAVTADGVCTSQRLPGRHSVSSEDAGEADTKGHPQLGARWHPEIPLPRFREKGEGEELPEGSGTGRKPGPHQGEDRVETWESVRVPAGEYRAFRTVQRLASGETATVWLAPGVGIVRRAWQQTGLVEELEAFHRPAPASEHEVVKRKS